jgi:hypothetical protein
LRVGRLSWAPSAPVLTALGVPISKVRPSGVFDVGAHSARAY